MSLNSFIPTLWSAAILENLNDMHVYVECMNKDFQKDLNVGDTVRINSIGRVTVGDYTKNSWSLTPEVLDGSAQTLVIDKAKYFMYGFDDIDLAQGKPSVVSSFAREAAWSFADTADVDAATALAAGVASGNVLTSTTIGSAGDTDIYDVFVELKKKLDRSNTPKGDRWAVIGPEILGELLKDPRFVSFGTQGNLDRAMNGMMEQVMGFKLMVSNNIPTSGAAYNILAGYKGAATYAESIPPGSPEAFRYQGGFADVIRSLYVYGMKVTRPDNLASIQVTIAN